MKKASLCEDFCYQSIDGKALKKCDIHSEDSNSTYESGNYYTDKNVARNNIRADTLMRKLRRFAAEHDGCVAPKDIFGCCYCILWDRVNHVLFPLAKNNVSAFSICFHTQKAAEAAIEEFHDELIWYFTEYDPMPEGWWEE